MIVKKSFEILEILEKMVDLGRFIRPLLSGACQCI